jgi:hypothetical protein
MTQGCRLLVGNHIIRTADNSPCTADHLSPALDGTLSLRRPPLRVRKAKLAQSSPALASSLVTAEGIVNIEANLAAFTRDLGRDARYASFDYCFNYFQSFREQNRTTDIAAPENMQMSCLQLGFYLASWGMFRGSSTLMVKSARHYVPVIDVIATASEDAWNLDAHRYTTGTWPVARQLDQQIRRAFGHPNGVTSTMTTKVMLGVFGNVPAFDTYFRAGFHSDFGPTAFSRLGEFYQEHADIIEHHRIPTLDFQTGQPTHRRYSRAKIIDMIFFIEGGIATTS